MYQRDEDQAGEHRALTPVLWCPLPLKVGGKLSISFTPAGGRVRAQGRCNTQLKHERAWHCQAERGPWTPAHVASTRGKRAVQNRIPSGSSSVHPVLTSQQGDAETKACVQYGTSEQLPESRGNISSLLGFPTHTSPFPEDRNLHLSFRSEGLPRSDQASCQKQCQAESPCSVSPLCCLAFGTEMVRELFPEQRTCVPSYLFLQGHVCTARHFSTSHLKMLPVS